MIERSGLSPSPAATVADGPALAAAGFAFAFFVVSLTAVYGSAASGYRGYFLLIASTLARAASFVLRASAAPFAGPAGSGPSVKAGSPALEAASAALEAAGFGANVAVCALALCSWFKNSSPWARPLGPRAAAIASMLACTLIPAAVVAGPILGAAGQGLSCGAVPASRSAAVGASLRVASASALLATAAAVACLAAFAAACVVVGATRVAAADLSSVLVGRAAPADVWRDPHALILLPLAAALALVPPAAQRVGALLGPAAFRGGAFVYGMAAGPELLSAALLGVVPELMARAAMAGAWGAFAAGRPARGAFWAAGPVCEGSSHATLSEVVVAVVQARAKREPHRAAGAAPAAEAEQ